jgi:hypothetical protein
MNSLDIFNVRALMRALEQIHSTMDLEVLPETLFSAVRELVAGAQLTFEQLDLRTGVVTSMTSRDSVFSEEIKKRILELMPTHPVHSGVQGGAERRNPGDGLHHSAAVPGYTPLSRNLASRRSALPDGRNIGCAWENRWDDRQSR